MYRLTQQLKGDVGAFLTPRRTSLRSGGLREKYEFVVQMRSNETQEALAREWDLSRIIIELQKRIEDMKASQEYEREVHARESFYLVKENESLKDQVRVAEKLFADARSMYDLELFKLRSAVSDMEDRLASEQENSKVREAEQESVIQKLCSNLYATQEELERYVEENSALASVQQSVEELRLKNQRTQRECTVWQEILRRREVFMLLERDVFVELQRRCMQERICSWRLHDELHQRMLSGRVEQLLNQVRSEADMYDNMKQLMLENVMAALERETWVSRHLSKSQELSRMSEQHEKLSLLLSQYMRELEENQKINLEQALCQKTLDDMTLSYVLRQRDDEISDKLRTWKGALREAHKLLTALLKRYEPFQRGDEVFVARVMEWLVSAPHVKEFVSVCVC
ncbi:hypothetical protein TRSC58_04162 [Trypanosoma rangeli SC58]|uniref:Uncharacterized protein n=1 Tax=Trypanosoma rangeli SC58 TaxID=429131 RepID=A0A061J1G6_TRYRA|nr:hypothetical protein TRSC58_04162 [Trypanosoma rangeli SC58]